MAVGPFPCFVQERSGTPTPLIPVTESIPTFRFGESYRLAQLTWMEAILSAIRHFTSRHNYSLERNEQ